MADKIKPPTELSKKIADLCVNLAIMAADNWILNYQSAQEEGGERFEAVDLGIRGTREDLASLRQFYNDRFKEDLRCPLRMTYRITAIDDLLEKGGA